MGSLNQSAGVCAVPCVTAGGGDGGVRPGGGASPDTLGNMFAERNIKLVEFIN